LCKDLPEVYGGEATEKSSVYEWHKWIKEGREKVEYDERSGHEDLTEPMKMLKKFAIWCTKIDVSVSTKLIMWTYESCYVKLYVG
jgi:hypothetical protein